MRKFFIFFVLFIFCSLSLHAIENHPMKIFGEAEVYSNNKAFSDAVDSYSGPGLHSNIGEGYGIRGGILKPLYWNGFLLGGSIGFIRGPQGEFVNEAIGKTTTNPSFCRVMAEVRQDLPIYDGGRAALRFRGAIGLAAGRLDQEVKTNSGTTSRQNGSWSGLSWEFGPSFMIPVGPKHRLEAGISYGGFPVFKETDDFYKFSWQPLVFHLGIEF